MSPSSCKGLPIEIVIEILTRLPVKSLVQFTSVCKSWYSLIKNPNFITTHLNRAISHANNSNNNNGYILVFPSMFIPLCDQLCFILCTNTFVDKLEVPLFTITKDVSLYLVGSCNGLLCLAEHYPNACGHDVYLWNPSIRKHKTLPRSQFVNKLSEYEHIALGFGYHHQSNDYKVVRILYLEYMLVDIPPEVEVYSSSTDSWRKIGASFPFHAEFSSAVCVNGAINWFATGYDRHIELIISFDISSEVFQKILFPVNCFDEDEKVYLWLMTFKESLSMLVSFLNADYQVYRCDIWVMKEYGIAESWSKQFKIVSSAGIIREVERPLGFTKRGQLIFENGDNNLVSLDLEEGNADLQLVTLGFKTLKHLDNRWFYLSYHDVVTSYTESLVLLEE